MCGHRRCGAEEIEERNIMLSDPLPVLTPRSDSQAALNSPRRRWVLGPDNPAKANPEALLSHMRDSLDSAPDPPPLDDPVMSGFCCPAARLETKEAREAAERQLAEEM